MIFPQVDAQRPSTWKRYQAKNCSGCMAYCCTLPVEVSANDLIRLGLTSEEEVSVSLKNLSKRLLKEKVIQKFNQKSQLFVLSQVRGSDCLYLDKNRQCTVYENRPEVCRTFPKIGPKPGFCPEKRISNRL